MSNYLAIATVTAALSDLLQAAIAPDVAGATVTTLRPDHGGMPSTGVNIFLYQVTPNGSGRNADLPTRRGSGDLVQRPRAALDLHYMLTCHGADAQLEPQRVLGSVVRTLHARPLLTRAAIRQTIVRAAFDYLALSDLAEEIDLVRFTPVTLSLEELSKLWSVYFQTPYRLSIAYQASVVFIEGEESVQPALPVQQRNIYVVPFRRPVIDEVRATGDGAIILPGSTVVVAGKRLRGEVTQVRIGDLPPITELDALSDTEIRFALPATALQAGVHGLQVVQPILMGTPPVEHRGTESNLAAFVIHPVIGDFDLADVVATGETRSLDLIIAVEPSLGSTQRAVLFLNELDVPANADRAPRAYSFDATARTLDSVTFAASGVFPGNYLLRVQIDGADSPLERDPDAAEPLFTGPKVTIA